MQARVGPHGLLIPQEKNCPCLWDHLDASPAAEWPSVDPRVPGLTIGSKGALESTLAWESGPWALGVSHPGRVSISSFPITFFGILIIRRWEPPAVQQPMEGRQGLAVRHRDHISLHSGQVLGERCSTDCEKLWER